MDSDRIVQEGAERQILNLGFLRGQQLIKDQLAAISRVGPAMRPILLQQLYDIQCSRKMEIDISCLGFNVGDFETLEAKIMFWLLSRTRYDVWESIQMKGNR